MQTTIKKKTNLMSVGETESTPKNNYSRKKKEKRREEGGKGRGEGEVGRGRGVAWNMAQNPSE